MVTDSEAAHDPDASQGPLEASWWRTRSDKWWSELSDDIVDRRHVVMLFGAILVDIEKERLVASQDYCVARWLDSAVRPSDVKIALTLLEGAGEIENVRPGEFRIVPA